MRFVDIEKAIDRALRKTKKWATRQNGLLDVVIRAMVGLYH